MINTLSSQKSDTDDLTLPKTRLSCVLPLHEREIARGRGLRQEGVLFIFSQDSRSTEFGKQLILKIEF